MEESAQKAIAFDSLEEGQLTTSLIDDVFFIIRKCIRYFFNHLISDTKLIQKK